MWRVACGVQLVTLWLVACNLELDRRAEAERAKEEAGQAELALLEGQLEEAKRKRGTADAAKKEVAVVRA